MVRSLSMHKPPCQEHVIHSKLRGRLGVARNPFSTVACRGSNLTSLSPLCVQRNYNQNAEDLLPRPYRGMGPASTLKHGSELNNASVDEFPKTKAENTYVPQGTSTVFLKANPTELRLPDREVAKLCNPTTSAVSS